MRHKFVSFLKQYQLNLKQDLAKFVLVDSVKAQEMRHRFSRFFKIKNRTGPKPVGLTRFRFFFFKKKKLV